MESHMENFHHGYLRSHPRDSDFISKKIFNNSPGDSNKQQSLRTTVLYYFSKVPVCLCSMTSIKNEVCYDYNTEYM